MGWDLLAGLINELQSPLTLLTLHAAVLQETAMERDADRARRIETAADQSARIVRAAAAIARIRPPAGLPVCARGLIEAALARTGAELRAAGVKVETLVDAGLPLILADETQLVEVLRRLIDNARQAMAGWEGPRRLCIAARAGDRALILSVTDSGPGVPAAIRDRVFDPFVTTRPLGPGAGLGLTWCRRVIEAHRGSIEMARSDLGGAGFDIRLPTPGRPSTA